MQQSGSGTIRDSAFASGRSRTQWEMQSLQWAALAHILPARRAYDGHYSNVGIDELCFQIGAGPEERSVQVLAANGSDQSLHEWVRQRYVGNGLDFHHFEYAKIGLPLMKSIQRIMIRAEVFRKTLPMDCSLEHPA